MKTCIIIDDEKNAQQTLSKMIARYYSKRLSVVGIADSVKEGVELIKKHSPDLVFLDVEMPGENGLQLFKYFDECNFDVVFTTAYEQYAINAIKYLALDYILKPINQIELGEAITKLERKDKINLKTSKHLEALLYNLNIDSQEYTKVAFPTKDGYELEKIRNIVYCQADINYCKVFTLTRQIYVSRPLKYVAELLPKDVFFRIHKSYLINMNYLSKFSRAEGGMVTLETGVNLPVSTRNIESLNRRLKKWN